MTKEERDLEPREDVLAIGLQVRTYNWRMRRAREAKALSQKELAELVGVDTALISKCELLRIPPRIDWLVLDRIADILGETTTTLFPDWLRGRDLSNELNVEMPVYLTEEMATTPDIAQAAIRAQLIQRLRATVELLPEREQRVLSLRFGLNGDEPITLEKAGRLLGVTREMVRQIEARALRHLRHPRIAKQLRVFMED